MLSIAPYSPEGEDRYCRLCLLRTDSRGRLSLQEIEVNKQRTDDNACPYGGMSLKPPSQREGAAIAVEGVNNCQEKSLLIDL